MELLRERLSFVRIKLFVKERLYRIISTVNKDNGKLQRHFYQFFAVARETSPYNIDCTPFRNFGLKICESGFRIANI